MIALAVIAAALAAAPPKVAGCPVFPASNVWNRRVDRLPVAPDSAAIMSAH